MIQPITYPRIPTMPLAFQGRQKQNGGNPDLKRLWDQGKLPTVKYGFYGDPLTPQNVTREHLEPASLGGTKRFGNIVLASKQKNNARGNKDIGLFANWDNAKRYLAQFKDVNLPELRGSRYIKAVIKTLKKLGWIN